MIVVDTNVLSELMRNQPDDAVMAWISSQRANDLWTTAITSAELLYGCARLPRGRRRDRMLQAVQAMLETDFHGRVLAFDAGAAAHFATLVAHRDSLGRPLGYPDAQIAGICLSRDATLATRNVKDFDGLAVSLVNPWDTLAS